MKLLTGCLTRTRSGIFGKRPATFLPTALDAGLGVLIHGHSAKPRLIDLNDVIEAVFP